MSLLDLIYPKRCVGCRKLGDYLCTSCFAFISFNEAGFCTVCQRAAIDGLTHPGCRTRYEIDGVFSSLAYKGIVKRLVYQFKYQPYLLNMGGLLVDLFYEGIIQKERFIQLLKPGIIFVPIPLHKKRMRERGYNQAAVLTAGLFKKLNNESLESKNNWEGKFKVTDLLDRVMETKAQFGLPQKARIANMQGAFALKKNNAEDFKKAQTIFLIDDIVTTGSTFREAARVLKKAGVKSVYGVAFAHGQ